MEFLAFLAFCFIFIFGFATIVAYAMNSVPMPGIFVILMIAAATYSLHLNPWDVLYWMAIGAVPYVIIGALWGVIKWYLFVKAEFVNYMPKMSEWVVWDEGITERVSRPPTLEEIKHKLDTLRPIPSEHKDEIICWMLYWPLSLIGTVLTQTFDAVYNMIVVRLDEISKRIFN